MRPTCRQCRYWCFQPLLGETYDYTHSVCGLHGCAAISDPDGTPPALMHKQNAEYDCYCGYLPLHRGAEPIQLTLF